MPSLILKHLVLKVCETFGPDWHLFQCLLDVIILYLELTFLIAVAHER